MPELRGKLDTSVNGPEDPDSVFDGDAWEQVDWRVHEERVRRLRCRIFKAAKDGDLATVRNLQKLVLRSWSNTLISVRQVTQRNTGRRTAGVDGQVALTSQARAEVAVRRVYCHTRQQAEQVKARLAVWLAPRGLAFNKAKTRIVRLDDEGFEFLG